MIFISIMNFGLENSPKFPQLGCVGEEKKLYLQNKLNFGDKPLNVFSK